MGDIGVLVVTAIVIWFILEIFIPYIWPVMSVFMTIVLISALVLGGGFGLIHAGLNYIRALMKNMNFRHW